MVYLATTTPALETLGYLAAFLMGGLLIGSAAALLLLTNGRIAGISGIARGLLPGGATRGEKLWRLAFILGLVTGGALVSRWLPQATALGHSASLPLMAGAGLLVGLGTALGNGCTSGHGICGLARLSPRSLTAVLVFMGAGFATVYVFFHMLGGR